MPVQYAGGTWITEDEMASHFDEFHHVRVVVCPTDATLVRCLECVEIIVGHSEREYNHLTGASDVA